MKTNEIIIIFIPLKLSFLNLTPKIYTFLCMCNIKFIKFTTKVDQIKLNGKL